jgi:hypothetical protein
MKMIATQNQTRQRLIIVVENKPFYCSSGKNSGHFGTWFFFGGALEEEYHGHSCGWFIKPRKSRHYSLEDFFGSYTWQFIKKLEIDRDISLKRFGDLPKMCISASLGGGFWETAKGRLLTGFLRDNYPMYFLPKDQINQIVALAKHKIPVINKPSAINSWLRAQGVSYAGNPKLNKQLVIIHDHMEQNQHVNSCVLL